MTWPHKDRWSQRLFATFLHVKRMQTWSWPTRFVCLTVWSWCVCVCVSIWRKYLHFWQVYCCWIGSEIVGWECAKVFCAIVWSSLLLEDAFRLWIEMTVWDNSSWSRKSNIKVFALHFSIVRCMMLEICSKTSFIVIICFSFFSYLLNNPSFFNAFVFFFFFIFLHNDDSSIAETASYRW